MSALVVGPLSREVRERKLFDRAWLGVAQDVGLTVVWVHTSEETAHARIVARAHPIDAYKLAHWDEYRQRRFMPSGAQLDGLLLFDNTAPAAADYEALLERIVSATASA